MQPWRVASKFVVDSADPKSESSEQCTCVECWRGGKYPTMENGLLNALRELIDLFAPGKDSSDNLHEAVNSGTLSLIMVL
jgi:ent-copalyl diphosphate synthase